ncbi:MAG: PRC-barrel domain-containing protein [Rhodomicrobium sp.]
MAAFNKFLCAVLLASLGGGGTVLAANAEDEFQPEFSTPPVITPVLHTTESVIGKRLVGASGENVGRIVDILVDNAGKVRAAIVDYGGFLGIGSRRIAVAWPDLRFGPGTGAIQVDLPRDRLARAPAVKTGEPVIPVSAHWQGPASLGG